MKNSPVKIKYWIWKAFNLPALKKSRLHWVDYLKGIAIILVVYRHSLLGIERSGITVPGYLVNANMIFYSFRMPLFFILSGIFVSRSLEKRSIKNFIATKFESLIYPYVIWVFIQVTLQIILSGFTNSHRGLIDYTYIFYQPRNLDQFWYLPALFNTTVVYLLLKRYLSSRWWVQLLLGIGFYMLSPRVESVSIISDWMFFYIFFALGDTISSFFFRPSVQSFFKNYLTLILAIPIFAAAQIYYLNNPTNQFEFLGIAFIGCFTMLAFAFRLQSWNILSWLRILGYHSIYIYVMHVMIAALIRILCENILGVSNPLAILLICIAGASVLPVIIYNLFIFNNAGWFLFTYKKKKHLRMTEEVKLSPSPVQVT